MGVQPHLELEIFNQIPGSVGYQSTVPLSYQNLIIAYFSLSSLLEESRHESNSFIVSSDFNVQGNK